MERRAGIEIGFIGDGQFKVIGKLDGSGRAHFFTTSAVNTTPQIELRVREFCWSSVWIVSAFAGQAQAQSPQAIHWLGIRSGFPRKPWLTSSGAKGYFTVAVPARIIVFSNFSIFCPYFSGERLRSMP